MDAHAEARDPSLVRLRGRNPLALVPIANPANAAPMVAVASALAPPEVGRVLLLTVVAPPTEGWEGAPPPKLLSAQQVLHESMMKSFRGHLAPEALLTVAASPWREIARVAGQYRCDSLLLGLHNLAEQMESPQLERLISEVDCDVTILNAPEGWRFGGVRRVLVPLGGRGGQDVIRARLLGALGRHPDREALFLRVLRASANKRQRRDALKELQRIAEEEAPGFGTCEVFCSDDPGETIIAQAAPDDLLILGAQRIGRRQKAFGRISLIMAHRAPCATILVSRAG